MKKLIIKFNESNDYICVSADEFHEDGNFIKAYKNNELVALVDINALKAAYITEQKE